MAIFTKITYAFLIISMAFIAINEGMNNRSGSSTSTNTDCMRYGTLIHVGDKKNLQAPKPNNPGVENLLKMTGSEVFKNSQVTLKVDNQSPCTVTNNSEIKCKITGDKLNGNLIFTTAKGTKITVPFANAPLFSENKCIIELGQYNIGTHETKLKINEDMFMITVKNGKMPIHCNKAITV
ncbi:hypothetical protein ACQ4LE_001164 [Meloidogyne hapla]